MARGRRDQSGAGLLSLLDAAFNLFLSELEERATTTRHADFRVSHARVFGNIDPDGSRLTELAERTHLTKQSVGEVVTDLEGRGYLERVPDSNDGRAKTIRLTLRGREVRALGQRLTKDIERDWAARYGSQRIRLLREALEAVTGE